MVLVATMSEMRCLQIQAVHLRIGVVVLHCQGFAKVWLSVKKVVGAHTAILYQFTL